MTNNDSPSFEQAGAEVAAEAGKLGELADELKAQSASCSEEQQTVGSWITTIGKALLAIFGVSGAGRN